MIENMISDLEAKIRAAQALDASKRTELLNLLGRLKTEVTHLSQTHSEDAASIAGFTNLSVAEGLKAKQNPKLLEIALDGTRTSVEKFEKSHPVLIQVVNTFCTLLSNIGI